MTVLEARIATLEERLKNIRANLKIRFTLGDGNCQYRGVAMQCRGYGNAAHARLKRNAIAYVEANEAYFLPYFVGRQPARELASWIASAQNGAWGDHLSLVAMSHVVKRPIAVWRCESVQKPVVCVPPAYDVDDLADPIYLELDERVPGQEHYKALSLRVATSRQGGAKRSPKSHDLKNTKNDAKSNTNNDTQNDVSKDLNGRRQKNNSRTGSRSSRKNNPKSNPEDARKELANTIRLLVRRARALKRKVSDFDETLQEVLELTTRWKHAELGAAAVDHVE